MSDRIRIRPEVSEIRRGTYISVDTRGQIGETSIRSRDLGNRVGFGALPARASPKAANDPLA